MKAVLPLFCLLLAAVAAKERKAICVITTGTVTGNVTFSQTEDEGLVTVTGIIAGLKPSTLHGFHVHEKGDLSSGCVSAAGHFNPHKKSHGGPTDKERHVGDLGNIEADHTGVSMISMSDKMISLTGEHSIIGRAIVVHQDRDDLGKGGFPDSLTTGHAGSRIGCCVIGIM